MGGFAYTDSPLPTGLVHFARLFDVVAIICYSRSCPGQIEAWTEAAPEVKLILVDAKQLNAALGLHNETSHGIVNAVAHGEVVIRANSEHPNAQNILIMEADYKWINETVYRDGVANEALKKFVVGMEWDVMRVGYHPMGESHDLQAPRRTHPAFDAGIERVNAPRLKSQSMLSSFDARAEPTCPRSCLCKQVVPNTVCAVTRTPNQPTVCDVRAAVAYAVNAKVGFARILQWRADAMARTPAAAKYKFHNDLWMPTEISPLHYLIPGLIFDGTPKKFKKLAYIPRMENFKKLCSHHPSKE
jgi:hypothetical protein